MLAFITIVVPILINARARLFPFSFRSSGRVYSNTPLIGSIATRSNVLGERSGRRLSRGRVVRERKRPSFISFRRIVPGADDSADGNVNRLRINFTVALQYNKR